MSSERAMISRYTLSFFKVTRGDSHHKHERRLAGKCCSSFQEQCFTGVSYLGVDPEYVGDEDKLHIWKCLGRIKSMHLIQLPGDGVLEQMMWNASCFVILFPIND